MTDHTPRTRSEDRFRVAACADVAGSDLLLYHRIDDLSEGGMCFTAPRADQVGSEIEVTLTFPRTQSEIPVRGEVVWVAEDETNRRVGLRWLELSTQERVELRTHIAASMTSLVTARKSA